MFVEKLWFQGHVSVDEPTPKTDSSLRSKTPRFEIDRQVEPDNFIPNLRP